MGSYVRQVVTMAIASGSYDLTPLFGAAQAVELLNRKFKTQSHAEQAVGTVEDFPLWQGAVRPGGQATPVAAGAWQLDVFTGRGVERVSILFILLCDFERYSMTMSPVRLFRLLNATQIAAMGGHRWMVI